VAIEAFAKRAGLDIVDWFYDPTVSGADPIEVSASVRHKENAKGAKRDPALLLAAKRLHRRSPKDHRRSLREIAHELVAMGYTNKRGAPYSACFKSMVEGPTRSLRLSNARFREASGWAPIYPSARQGWIATAKAPRTGQ
jgi:hypothetical protein